MPITKSAIKALRSSKRKRQVNLARKDKAKNSLAVLKSAIKKKDKAAAQKAFVAVQKSLDKAAKWGVIHKKKAARKKSRLVAQIRAL